jgi:hypothetical protein
MGTANLEVRKNILPDHFWALLAYRRQINAQKSPKQAVWDHFPILLDFST